MAATIGPTMDENMATKSDPQGLEQILRQEIGGLRREIDGLRREILRREMRKAMENLTNDLAVCLVGMFVAGAIILGIVSKL